MPHAILRDKVLSMLFFFTSTRTRNSFEAGMAQLGGHAQFIDHQTTQISHGDTAKKLAKSLAATTMALLSVNVTGGSATTTSEV